jgi:hypothetical protein
MRNLTVGLLATLLAGCNLHHISLSDDVDTKLTFFILASGATEGLHSPYVRGARFTLYASTDESTGSAENWQIVSSDTSVLDISSAVTGAGNQISVGATARGAGSAVIKIIDGGGHVLASEPVDVKVPDNAKIEANGPLVIGRPDSAATVNTPSMVTSGVATFLVRWFAGGVELHGNGVLNPDSNSVGVMPESSYLSVQRDWLQLTAPATPGNYQIGLSADGVYVTQMSIQVVPASDISSISLSGEDESHASLGTYLAVLAQAVGASGAPIYGIEYKFDVDGDNQAGFGDLYRYTYLPGTPKTLTAKMGTMSSNATIHAGTGYVDSTNNVGCSSTGASGTAQLVGLCAAALWLGRKSLVERAAS